MHAALWIGNASLPEFAPAADTLRDRLRLVVVPTIDDALRAAGEFDVTIIAEAVPGEHLGRSLDSLRRHHAGAPIVRLVGPLCDGELRSSPPEATHRIRWIEAAAGFARDCDALASGSCPSWGRPTTQSAEETVLEMLETPGKSVLFGLRIGVDAHDSALSSWLGDAVRAWGASPCAVHDRQPLPFSMDVVVHQSSHHEASELAALAKLRHNFPHSRIVVLAAFLRREMTERSRSAGADVVVSLPASVGELERLILKAS